MGRVRALCIIVATTVSVLTAFTALVLITLFPPPELLEEEPFPGGAYVVWRNPSDPGDDPPCIVIRAELRARSKEDLLAYVSYRQEALLEYVQLRSPENMSGTVTFRYPMSMEEFRDFLSDFRIAEARLSYVHREGSNVIGFSFWSLNTAILIDMLNDQRVLLVDPSIDLTIEVLFEKWQRKVVEEFRRGWPVFRGIPRPIWDEYVKYVVNAAVLER